MGLVHRYRWTDGLEGQESTFVAYLAQGRDTAERLLAVDFVFTSPQDDHIDKAAYLERCFPTADRLTSQEVLEQGMAACSSSTSTS